jgi:hypothetical protein
MHITELQVMLRLKDQVVNQKEEVIMSIGDALQDASMRFEACMSLTVCFMP